MNFVSADYNFNSLANTLVIAEVGVNHNGSTEIAKAIVDASVANGADIVKFQAFISENEISRFAPKTQYQINTTSDSGNQLDMCKALELSHAQLIELFEYCKEKQVPFLCAAFDYESVDFLVDVLKVKTIKIPSGEITNVPFLEYIASRKLDIILSTGGSSLLEVARAVTAIRTISNKLELILLHCVSSYPAPTDQTNINVIKTLRDSFQVPVGYSDHSAGSLSGIVASIHGACVIEKHITLDKNMEGPDHLASIEPHELRSLSEGILLSSKMIGNGRKEPAMCEIENIELIRKSVVAIKDLTAGHLVTQLDLGYKRPATGIPPFDVDKIIGLKLTKAVQEDEPITWEHFQYDV